MGIMPPMIARYNGQLSGYMGCRGSYQPVYSVLAKHKVVGSKPITRSSEFPNKSSFFPVGSLVAVDVAATTFWQNSGNFDKPETSSTLFMALPPAGMRRLHGLWAVHTGSAPARGQIVL